MFHVAKYTTTETTWDSLQRQDVTARTDVENINTTVATDWRGVMVPCTCETDELEVDW